MRMIAIIIGLLGLFMLGGCSNGVNTEANEAQMSIGADSTVPDWLYESINEKVPEVDLAREEIRWLRVNMKQSKDPQIAAYATPIGRIDGIFVLYEPQDGRYREVYVKRNAVYGVQVHGGYTNQVLGLIAGVEGGTGIQKNNLFLIRHTPQGYEDVWSDVAEHFVFGPTSPGFHLVGNVNFTFSSGQDEFVYTRTKLIFEDVKNPDIAQPDATETVCQVFRYNDQTRRYELVSTLEPPDTDKDA